jgi:hypothetical protein
LYVFIQSSVSLLVVIERIYVPSWVGHSKNGPEYRFIVIRKRLEQLELPGMGQQDLPFPTMRFNSFGRYKGRTKRLEKNNCYIN